MNSLQDLNNWGATEVDYLDSRPSGVVFNRQAPLGPVDQTFDAYASLTVTPTPGIEIVDIINYQTANVRYRVTVKTGSSPAFTGSTVTFGTLPSGASLTQVGSVYTISGIHKISDWDAVKNFTWTLPVDFASYPQWYLECTIIYYSSALATDVETTWEIYDDRFYNVAALSSTSSITAYLGINSPAAAALTSTATVYANPWNQLYGEAAFSTEAAFVCEGNVNVTFLNAASFMTVNAVKTARITDTLATASSMSINAVASAINLDPRTYLANQGNAIFATNTPQVDSLNPADTFSIVLSSSLGTFAANSTDAPTSTVTIAGTETVVNAAFVNVHFYPTKDSSTSGTFTWAQSRNGTLEFSKTIALTGIANSFAETTLTFLSSGTFNPTRSQVYYGFADVLLVGGGGGGAEGGGGGGGGVRYVTNQSLSSISYSIVVGAGGTAGSDANPGSPYSLNGGNGGNTTALGYTANGGTGGKNTTTIVSSIVYHDLSGGASGSPTSFAGGSRSGVRQVPFSIGGGGGGAGQVGAAPDLTSPGFYGGNGGNGITNSITGTSTYYGGGGGGNVAEQIFGSTFQGMGGLGGGGDGADFYGKLSSYQHQSDGVNGLGGGGGGGSSNAEDYFQIGTGGSGVVIIKIHA